MSPALQDAVPIGTLEARIMNFTPPSASESRSTDLVSRAYKLQGFSNAADKLLGAATRLDEEASREKRYWEQIVSIKQKGWSISKVPRDARSLGVHFGFRDAAPVLRNRGFAVLRRNADGSLRLDQGAVPSKPVAVRLSILRDGVNCGMSNLPYSPISDAATIDEQILQARNALFEEELFYELGREARLLADQGATMSSKRMNMPMDEKTHLQIDLIDLNNDSPPDASSSDQQLAEGIAITFRILLSHAHEEALQRRSQPPPPMTLKPRTVPEHPLIRPILTHLQHRKNSISLTTFLKRLLATLSTASVSCTIEPSSSSNPLLNSQTTLLLLDNPKPSVTTATATNLLSTLTAPLTTTTILTLPTGLTLKITTHTNFNPPTFGTEYSFSPPTLTYPSTRLTLPRLSTRSEVEKLLCHVLTVDTVALIASTSSPPPSFQQSDLNAKDATTRHWIPEDPHSGTLSHSQGQEKLHLKILPHHLGLRYLRGPEGAKRGADVTGYMWGADCNFQVVTAMGKTKIKIRGDEGDGDGDGKAEVRRGLLDITNSG
jgi:mediator of RNA polymerase II transcription subunit 17, fungi type